MDVMTLGGLGVAPCGPCNRRPIAGLGADDRAKVGMGGATVLVLLVGIGALAWGAYALTSDRYTLKGLGGKRKTKRKRKAKGGLGMVGALYNNKTGKLEQEFYAPFDTKAQLMATLSKFAKRGQTPMIYDEGGYGDAPECLKFNVKTGKRYKGCDL